MRSPKKLRVLHWRIAFKYGYRWRIGCDVQVSIFLTYMIKLTVLGEVAIVSLKPTPVPTVPTMTAEVARAAFPQGNPYLSLRDELGSIFNDTEFADLFPARGQPGLPPWCLALVTVLQFQENLSDRQAADAVRARIDWKYLLGLELKDAGFDFSVLSEFRTRLVNAEASIELMH